MSSGRFQGKGALVTGAGRGIGRATALALAKEGAAVLLVARSREELEGAASEIRAHGGTAAICVADLTTEAGIGEVVRAAETLFAIDVLINNVGGNVPGPYDGLDPTTWWDQVRHNIWPAYMLSRAFAPAMAERGWGRIVNVSSIMGKLGAPLNTAYCTAKHGLLGFTRSLAAELARTGVTVNAVCPGYVPTVAAKEAFSRRAQYLDTTLEKVEAAAAAMMPQGEILSVDDVTPAILYLASDEAKRTTGEALNVSGGGAMH